jgi:hypothetical protein
MRVVGSAAPNEISGLRLAEGELPRSHVCRGCLATKGTRPPHSITLSARASSEGGTVIPSAFAVLTLIRIQILLTASSSHLLGAIKVAVEISEPLAAAQCYI